MSTPAPLEASSDAAARELGRAVRDRLPELRVSVAPSDRVAYARDVWPRELIAEARAPSSAPGPALVAWPERDSDVAALIELCGQEGAGLVPFGAGSGVCGAILPEGRTIVCDTKRLGGIELDPASSSVSVGAGVLGIDLEEHLERRGFTVGHFPSSILCSTVGGWLAARGAGQCSSRYGKIEDMTLAADAVLGTGDAVRFHRRLHGPQPLELLIGSEGTVGVVTRAVFRLHPAPAERRFAAYRFPSFTAGADAMRELLQSGLRPAVLRLYDPLDSFLLDQGKVERPRRKHRSAGGAGTFALRHALARPRLLRAAVELFERARPSAALIVAFEGSLEQASEEAERADRLLRGSLGAAPLGEAPARAWFRHRYAVSYRQSVVFRRGAFNDTLEVAMPWSRLEPVYRAVRRAAGRHALVLAHLSHAYPDGCSIYFTLVGERPADARRHYEEVVDATLGAALSEGASLSHHHGVGRSKAKWLDVELGGGMPALRAVRRAWDPRAVLNPGALEPSGGAATAVRPLPELGIDVASQLGHFSGDAPLLVAEQQARERGLTLGFSEGAPSVTVAGWVARGFQGIDELRWDPVLRPMAGLACSLPGGTRFELAPAPRRAVGPDLFALAAGAGLGRVERASLVLHRPAAIERRAASADVPLEGAERDAWRRIEAAFGGTKKNDA